METLLLILENPALMNIIGPLAFHALSSVIARFTSNEVGNKYAYIILRVFDAIAFSSTPTKLRTTRLSFMYIKPKLDIGPPKNT